MTQPERVPWHRVPRPTMIAPVLLCALACDRPPPAPEATTPQQAPSAPDPAPGDAEGQPGADPEPEPAPPDEVAEVMALGPEASTSIGGPAEGRLDGSVALPLRGPGFVFNPRKNPASRHGTVELVQALVRAAAAVHESAPGNTLIIGDLSRPEGGTIPGHASHRAGRDVDVLFYMLDPGGKPTTAVAAPVDLAGEATDYNDLADPSDDVPLRFDVPRNWEFVQALVLDDDLQLQKIFVAEHLRAMLLKQARRVKAPKKAIQRFSDLTCQPRAPHDDHFHFRVFCTPQDIAAGCEDMLPIYPWQKQRLKAAGTTAKIAGRRKKPRPKLTGRKEARKKAGAMHPSVTEFLDRREKWAKKPHPGRRWCK